MDLIGRRAPRVILNQPRSTPTVRVGLFETSSDVDNCAHRVGAMIDALDRDGVSFYVKRYGPDMFGASISDASKLDQFHSDRTFFQSWRAFKDTFEKWKIDWDARFVSILSADAYRECEKYDLEAKDWHDRFEARGIRTSAPKTTTPSPLPGIIPDTPPKGDGGNSGVGWMLLAGVALGAVVLVKVLA